MKTSTDELLVFVSVIDSGSITAAAEKLGQTVSGVSRALTRLEKKLDTALVRRTTRRLQLTEEGEGFLQRARAILDAMEEAEESVARKRRRPSGRLRVDAASPFMLHCIAPHMTAFSALYPEIRLELTSSERIVDLLEQKVARCRTRRCMRVRSAAASCAWSRVPRISPSMASRNRSTRCANIG
jgi:DNA-binding transcriptional LysR family regulator